MPTSQGKRSSPKGSSDRRKKNAPPPIGLLALLALLLCVGLGSLGWRVVRTLGTLRKKDPDMVSMEAPLTGGEESSLTAQGQPTDQLTDQVSAPDPYADKPQIDTDSWELILANPTHSVQDYEPEVAPLEDIYLDVRIIEPMEEFVQAARDQGLSVLLASGYRSYEEQSWLFDLQVEMYGDEQEAATIVARPGTSEHQTGLAADITDDYYEIKNEELENTQLYQWMSTHCQDYGFIVRFPKGKEAVTGIIYEPWHFRYVGKEVASYIASHDLTLEEFLALYEDLDSTANISASSVSATDAGQSASPPGEVLKPDPFGVPVSFT